MQVSAVVCGFCGKPIFSRPQTGQLLKSVFSEILLFWSANVHKITFRKMVYAIFGENTFKKMGLFYQKFKFNKYLC